MPVWWIKKDHHVVIVCVEMNFHTVFIPASSVLPCTTEAGKLNATFPWLLCRWGSGCKLNSTNRWTCTRRRPLSYSFVPFCRGPVMGTGEGRWSRTPALTSSSELRESCGVTDSPLDWSCSRKFLKSTILAVTLWFLTFLVSWRPQSLWEAWFATRNQLWKLCLKAVFLAILYLIFLSLR